MGRDEKNLLVFILVGLFIFAGTLPAQARENYRSLFNQGEVRSMPLQQILSSKETCIQCHTRVTPRAVEEFRSSAHNKAGLDCVSCHGADHSSMSIVTGKKVCQKCHQQETKEMLASKHSSSWFNSWRNPRYEVLPKSMRQQGCARCHDISYGMGNVGDVRCDYCHKSHDFSLKEARSPLACSTCHMGPDHPQAEAYESSAHGKAYFQGKTAPTCITCHQSEGTHKVSGTISPETCSRCHEKNFAGPVLAKGSNAKAEADKTVSQARQVLTKLDKESLLYPSPEEREANPAEGNKLVLDKNILYNGTSKAEAIFFRIFKFAGVGGWKSAYHQDFQGTDSRGDKQLQQLSGELDDEAKVLRLLGDGKAARASAKKQWETEKTRAFILFAAAGVILGVLLALAVFRFKKIKGKMLTGIFFLVLFSVLACAFPSQVLAWDGKGDNQGQCVSCHSKQAGQLKQGRHAALKCLDCHRPGEKADQAKKPETCGKCHSGRKGYQLETYMSSPHGIKYRVTGPGQWVPTCATCHMPGGGHSPVGARPAGQDFLSSTMGKGCLKCHTTDEMMKFGKDLDEIYSTTDQKEADLRQAGLDLINKGILISDESGSGNEELQRKWGKGGKWKLVNQDKLPADEQVLVRKLISQLVARTSEGVNEASPKTRIGAAHVNPDYAHWYGNAYLNLDLDEVKGTAAELETFAYRAGYAGPGNTLFTWQGLAIIVLAVGAGFGITYVLLKRTGR